MILFLDLVIGSTQYTTPLFFLVVPHGLQDLSSPTRDGTPDPSHESAMS